MITISTAVCGCLIHFPDYLQGLFVNGYTIFSCFAMSLLSIVSVRMFANDTFCGTMALYSFSIFESILIAIFASGYDQRIVLINYISTWSIFAGLTAYSIIYYKRDFRTDYAMLISSLTGLNTYVLTTIIFGLLDP